MFYKETLNGVDFYRSTLLSHVPHGFSTKVDSDFPTVGYGKEDGEFRETVLENRKRFALAVGIVEPFAAKDRIFTSGTQIHSDKIEYITSGTAADRFECDGFFTDDENVAVAVKTADCVPILLASGDGRFVAAVHAGWRGTAQGIAALAVEKLLSLGADLSEIRAAIGPSISPEVYRVGDDFASLLYGAMANSAAECVRENTLSLSRDFLLHFPDGIHCDLWNLNREILILSGLSETNIDVAEICTFKNEEFYSHRRQGTNRDVMASLIAPKSLSSQ